MTIYHFVAKIMDVYPREDHMVSMDGDPLLSSGEVVDTEASGSNPPLPSNLCYTCS
jgi:hypothetical protein